MEFNTIKEKVEAKYEKNVNDVTRTTKGNRESESVSENDTVKTIPTKFCL